MDLTRPKTILICPAIILGDSQIPRVQGGCLSCEICQGDHRTGIVLAEHLCPQVLLLVIESMHSGPALRMLSRHAQGLAPALTSYLLTSEQDQLQGALKPTCKPTLVQLADLAAAFVSLGSGCAGSLAYWASVWKMLRSSGPRSHQ